MEKQIQSSDAPKAPDRRKLRSQRSQQKIKTALLHLLDSGNLMPRVEDLSAETGLSIRTVFRHIEDKEHLIREIAEETMAEILPIVMQPYRSTEWREQVLEIRDRRMMIWDKVYTVRACAQFQRFRSDYITSLHATWLTQERSALLAILPEEVRADTAFFEALNAALGFNTWLGLRLEQKMDAAQASAVIERMVSAQLQTWDR